MACTLGKMARFCLFVSFRVVLNSFMLDLGTWDAEEAAERIADGNVCYQDANVVTIDQEKIIGMNVVAWGLVGDVGIVAEDVDGWAQHATTS